MEYYNVRGIVFAVQGDNIFDVNLKELIEFHLENEAVMTMALREVKLVWRVGLPERYLGAMRDLLEGRLSTVTDYEGRIRPEIKVWVQGESFESMRRRRKIVQKIMQGKIEVKGTVLISRHCEVGDGTRIANSCIDNFTKVGRGVIIENSAVMDRSNIRDGAEIRDSIIGRHVTINSCFKKPTRIWELSVIADDVIVEEGSF